MSRNFLTVSLALLLNGSCIYAQRYRSTLNGVVNCDSGKVLLMPLIDSSYYPPTLAFSSEYPIGKGQFQIRQSWSYPFMASLVIKINGEIKYVSDYFLVDSGRQDIVCNIDSLRESPKLENKYMAEMKLRYDKAFSAVDSEYNLLYSRYDSFRMVYKNGIPEGLLAQYEDRRSILKAQSKRTLLRYVEEHPNSYVALWKLVGQLQNGYDSLLERAYGRLSVPLQQNVTGAAFSTKLRQLKRTAIGAVFPKLPLSDMRLKGVRLDIALTGKKYTLVDFWYSHCNPCISQFGDLSELYKAYSTKGFAIVGISTDRQKYLSDWRKVIEKYALPWTQLLDLNGIQAEKLAILAFPSNFLCDSEGRIIEADIQPAQLSAFLKAQLGDRSGVERIQWP